MKLAVRKFIIDKIRDSTRMELDDLAVKHGLSPFHVAGCFDYEVFRIEKLFRSLQDELQDSND